MNIQRILKVALTDQLNPPYQIIACISTTNNRARLLWTVTVTTTRLRARHIARTLDLTPVKFVDVVYRLNEKSVIWSKYSDNLDYYPSPEYYNHITPSSLIGRNLTYFEAYPDILQFARSIELRARKAHAFVYDSSTKDVKHLIWWHE